MALYAKKPCTLALACFLSCAATPRFSINPIPEKQDGRIVNAITAFDSDVAENDDDDQLTPAALVDKNDAAALIANQKIAQTVSTGASPDSVSFHMQPAILVAAQQGDLAIVRQLLDLGASVDAMDVDGNTALIASSVQGHSAIVEELLKRGAKANLANLAGITPLMAAAFAGSVKTAQLLMSHGAETTPKVHGLTALEIAKKAGNDDFVDFLSDAQSAPKFHVDPGLGVLGEQSRNIRSDILNSFFVQDEFLIQHPNLPLSLSYNELNLLTAQVGSITELVQAMYLSNRENLEAKFGKNLPAAINIQVVVKDNGAPLAQTFKNDVNDGSTSFAIIVDASLLKSLYISSTSRGFKGIDAATVAQQIKFTDDIRRRAENFSVVSPAGLTTTQFGGISANGSSAPAIVNYIMLADLSQKTHVVENKYYGTLLFIIAHELGHIALGHLTTPVICQDRELNADGFAATLLGQGLIALSTRAVNFRMGGVSAPMGFLDDDLLADYTGFSLFFDHAYEKAEFPPSAEGCIYPTAEERSTQAKQIVADIRRTRGDDIERFVTRLYDLHSTDSGQVLRRLLTLQGMK